MKAKRYGQGVPAGPAGVPRWQSLCSNTLGWRLTHRFRGVSWSKVHKLVTAGMKNLPSCYFDLEEEGGFAIGRRGPACGEESRGGEAAANLDLRTLKNGTLQIHEWMSYYPFAFCHF